MVHIRHESKAREWDHVILTISSGSRALQVKESAGGTLSLFRIKVIKPLHKKRDVYLWKWINQARPGQYITSLILTSQQLQWNLIMVYSKWMAGWDKKYTLTFFLIGMGRVCPEEGGSKSVRSKRYSLNLQGLLF